MDDIEELIESLRVVYANLARLQQMDGPEMLLPGRVATYRSCLEDAYVVYGRAANRMEELGQLLQSEQQRLDLGVKQYGPASDELDIE